MATIVSTFELLVKPIAPRAILPTAALQSVARRVVQGYFLTITNLETVDLRFQLEFFDSLPIPDNVNRRLSVSPRNFDLIFDIAGANTPLIDRRITLLLRPIGGTFILPAGQTASVQLLPSLTPFIPVIGGEPIPLPSPVANPNPDIEIRGYAQLTLPGNFRFIPGGGFVFERQLDRPAKVLLQPEVRGTFLPNNFPAVTTGDFDQINYSLVTASGQALNEVEAEGVAPIIISPGVIDGVIDRLATSGIDLENIQATDVNATTNLVETLSRLDPSAENLSHLSDLISKLNIPIRMQSV